VQDWVFLRIQPYKKMSLKQPKKENKLAPKYYGPYKVFQRIGSMAYKLELTPSSRVHPLFHVSCLKKVINNKIPAQTILPELNEEGKIILEPETILKMRIKQLRNRPITEPTSGRGNMERCGLHAEAYAVRQVFWTTIVSRGWAC
jgi:hypothetical protein